MVDATAEQRGDGQGMLGTGLLHRREEIEHLALGQQGGRTARVVATRGSDDHVEPGSNSV